ncbi:heme peroxidase [Mycoemilia scoparia]|uniref:Peroxidase n=1 Tax=Mycoemilia scoparia TaxID=417184 RepID=A0A9W8A3D1_9FUNG|nr:heme peroxidase [Mycoemilia scoparia]
MSLPVRRFAPRLYKQTTTRFNNSSLSSRLASQTRFYATRQALQFPKARKSGPSPVAIGTVVAGVALGYFLFKASGGDNTVARNFDADWRKVDYNKVYREIAELLEDEDYDDGSYGPVFVRLAWHTSGTFDKTKGDGGSTGGTIRFHPEAGYGANAGLDIARNRLEVVKRNNPQISYGDLYTLAGVVAVQELGGPVIPWRPGREERLSASSCTSDGRLPDGAKGASHVRDIFYRMGFDDKEITALIGAHTLGRCHPNRSGFDGPWNASPTTFTNFFFTELKNQDWVPKKWDGPFQYVDKASGQFMMLPADMAFLTDPKFRVYVDKYADDEEAFFKDFAGAFSKLLSLGVKFPDDAPVYKFKTLDL